ncbi:murein biosynthesis integral membrane protein MurJ [Paraburkholderia terricola]|uniref:Peptidoglycan biosynthesis protein MviN/MurJ, putative lipid II flippase n=1 Tax=Paraburkholderia terricola TaxID=169427 RepID=A0A1M6UZA8_9BURK|nr:MULTISPECIES: lipid II flippase MurJ [Paraburkholderia]SDO92878.1 Peptidoglycan biosynthesis protein MviN/MurJ, putative lipid II flippase [Paraburkholderia sediminicola]SHK74533.1 Peptidoglycan biosynthesis protein MviN/MurJ, putative lipid II flippase [Paraburkholderia terricola]
MRISVFVLAGRCAGALKEMAVAYRYGTGPVVDAYQLTMTLVGWLPVVIATIFIMVLVPVFVDLRAQPLADQTRFLGELEAWAIAVGAALTLLLYACWPLALQIGAKSLSAETRALCRQMILTMGPVGALMLVSSAYAARLQSRERHINTLLEGLPAGFVLAFVLSIGDQTKALPLIYGTIGGYVVQTLVVRALSVRVDPIRYRLRLTLKAPQWQRVFRAVRVLALGQVVMCCTPILDQFFVVAYGDGAVATVGYTNRILSLLLSMGALAIGQAILPILSDIIGVGDLSRARHTAVKWTMLMFLLGSAIALVSWLLAPQAVALLFQRGAFTARDTAAVTELFRWGQMQVPFYFSGLVLLTLFASAGSYREMATIALLSFLVKVAANVVMTHWLAVPGIFAATALTHATTLICYLVYVQGWPTGTATTTAGQP